MIKRLSGGLILLNLSNISLNTSAGEVDITDEEVLNQLTELREFIDVNRDFSKGFKNLKPVLIECRSSGGKFNTIVQGNLSFHTDALHMSIGALTNVDGKYLNINIAVVYEHVDFVGYQVKSAKLNAYEKTAVTGESIIGDADITGDLSVGGAITGNSIVEKMSGYSFELLSSDVNIVYVGAVKNGNKLTLVAFGSFTKTTNYIVIGNFIIPTDVANKIYPYQIDDIGDIVDAKTITITNASSLDTYYTSKVLAQKEYTRNIKFQLRDMDSIPNDTQVYFRYEVTFLLSDNLIANE